MKYFYLAAMAINLYACHAARTAHTTAASLKSYNNEKGIPVLLGVHTKADLQQPPYKEWFDKNESSYTVDSATAEELKPLVQTKQFEIFMGTWCGDSRREVPRMLKILSYAGVPASHIKLIMVDNRDSVYKQSPGHEEKGKFIHRVPDLLVYYQGKEMNRVVESPVVSIEHDLLSIIKGIPYEPHYKAASYLQQLAAAKTDLTHDTVALLLTLRGLVTNSAELNSLGYVWTATGDMQNALAVFELNAALFSADVNVYDSLAEINTKLGRTAAAKLYYARILQLQPENTQAKIQLEKLSVLH